MSELKNVILVLSEDKHFSPAYGEILKQLEYGFTYANFSNPFIELDKNVKKIHTINFAQYLFNLFSNVEENEIVLDVLCKRSSITLSKTLFDRYFINKVTTINSYKRRINELVLRRNDFMLEMIRDVMPAHDNIFIWSDILGVKTLDDYMLEMDKLLDSRNLSDGDVIKFYINDVIEYKPLSLNINHLTKTTRVEYETSDYDI